MLEPRRERKGRPSRLRRGADLRRYWPAIYLIDADGFVRCKHFGEGAYHETEEKIEELLSERDRISG